MQPNRFSTPSKNLMASAVLGASVFWQAAQADASQMDPLACERAAAILLNMENQNLLEGKPVSSRVGYDQLVGLGYVSIGSKRPSGDDWSSVSFTGKDGVVDRESATKNFEKILTELLHHQWELLQHARNDTGVYVLGRPVDDRTLLTLSGAKGVSWVMDYAESGSPAAMLEDLPPAIARIIGGEGPEELLGRHIEISSVDISEVARNASHHLSRGDLPISFERLVGTGIIPIGTPRPKSWEEYADIEVVIGGERTTLERMIHNEALRERAVMTFISEVQDEIASVWKGSDHITPEEAVHYASVRGVSEAIRVAMDGPNDSFDAVMEASRELESPTL